MEKANLNLLIFDDEEGPSTNKIEMRKYTQKSKNSKPSDGINSNESNTNGYSSEKNLKKEKVKEVNSQQIVLKQISELQQKIINLQRQSQKLKYELQKSNDLSMSNANGMQSNGCNGNKLKQVEQVLLLIQRKIQILIQESKKTINKMNETFTKKLIQLSSFNQGQNTKAKQSNQKQKNSIFKMEMLFKEKIQQYEKCYKNAYQKLIAQTKQKQEIMMKKLSQIQLKFNNKLNSFQTKQKQYINWIHHLQAKLKQKKVKKMITITQEKPQLMPIPSKNSLVSNQNQSQLNNVQNMPSANFQTSKINCSIDQNINKTQYYASNMDPNNSKIARKHKIFSGKSTSPIPRDSCNQLPTQDINSHKGQKNSLKGSQSNNQEYPKTHENHNFYNQLKRQSAYQHSSNQIYGKNKVQGWDKFADMNDFNEQYNESQSDDFFTPIEAQQDFVNYQRVLANIPLDSRGGTYYGESTASRNNYGNQLDHHSESEKVFSPFDLN